MYIFNTFEWVFLELAQSCTCTGVICRRTSLLDNALCIAIHWQTEHYTHEAGSLSDQEERGTQNINN